MFHRSRHHAAALAVAAAGLCACAQASAQPALARVTGAGAAQPDAPLRDTALASDGSAVVFVSTATNLLPGGNGIENIYRYEVDSHALTRVSVAPGSGEPANTICYAPAISGNGRVVAFESFATNLVAGSSQLNVFRRDVATGTITRISDDGTGAEGNNPARTPALSGDGRYTVFVSAASNLVFGDTNGMVDVFLHDASTNTLSILSLNRFGQFADGSVEPLTTQAISRDGQRVVFSSRANSMTPVNGNGQPQAYLFDRTTNLHTLLSHAPNGALGDGLSDQSTISANGRFVAFRSTSSNLVPGSVNRVYRYDRQDDALINLPLPAAADFDPPLALSPIQCRNPRATDAGDVLATCDFTSPAPPQVFLWSAASAHWRLVSRALAGPSVFGDLRSGPAGGISADGQRLAFDSQATNLVAGDSNASSDVMFEAAPRPDLIFRNGFE
jgi:Tol biopolymer transport system component